MTIRIVTDSGSDLPREIAGQMNISVVPLRVYFGDKSYQDGVDLRPEDFFRKLVSESIHPTTSSPPPGDFAEVYNRLSEGCEGIVSIHLSSKVSATYDAALEGRDIVSPSKCPIAVVDSRLITIPLALVAMAAARAAAAGKGMQEILGYIQQLIPATPAFGLLDTLKYIIKSGRLGKAGAAMGSMLPVKPLLTIKDGGVSLVGVVRTRSKGIERLLELIKSVRDIQEVGIAHSAADEEIASFVEKLQGFLPDIRPMIGKLGPAIGTHGGPGTILVAMRQKLGQTIADMEEGKKPIVSLPSLQYLKDSILQRRQKDTAPFVTGRSMSAAIL